MRLLITGATDGIGLATANLLAARNHHVILHGRSAAKLDAAESAVRAQGGAGSIELIRADLSHPAEVRALAHQIRDRHDELDALINNAGVFVVASPTTSDGLDVRFAVNTIAPYLLARLLRPLLGPSGRIVNLSSAAQASVDAAALSGHKALADREAYAQSKLALTMLSAHLAAQWGPDGPVVVAVNPGSLLGTKMVKQGFQIEGKDVGIGADILARAACSDEFADASGRYFDNDSGQFADPHPDALDAGKNAALVQQLETVLEALD